MWPLLVGLMIGICGGTMIHRFSCTSKCYIHRWFIHYTVRWIPIGRDALLCSSQSAHWSSVESKKTLLRPCEWREGMRVLLSQRIQRTSCCHSWKGNSWNVPVFLFCSEIIQLLCALLSLYCIRNILKILEFQYFLISTLSCRLTCSTLSHNYLVNLLIPTSDFSIKGHVMVILWKCSFFHHHHHHHHLF